jgi:predicted Zn finger-like uncharacterized protein
METRCKKCNKLFRVSDDKITGTGIKFPCTRCGDYVKITREDFEHYTLSRGAEAVPADLFEQKPTSAESPLWPETAAPQVRIIDLTLPRKPRGVSVACVCEPEHLTRYLQRRPNRSLNLSPSPHAGETE